MCGGGHTLPPPLPPPIPVKPADYARNHPPHFNTGFSYLLRSVQNIAGFLTLTSAWLPVLISDGCFIGILMSGSLMVNGECTVGEL